MTKLIKLYFNNAPEPFRTFVYGPIQEYKPPGQLSATVDMKKGLIGVQSGVMQSSMNSWRRMLVSSFNLQSDSLQEAVKAFFESKKGVGGSDRLQQFFDLNGSRILQSEAAVALSPTRAGRCIDPQPFIRLYRLF